MSETMEWNRRLEKSYVGYVDHVQRESWHKSKSTRDSSADEAEVIVHERSDGENVVGVYASSHDF